MKCFIASAFDTKDVDEIYDEVITPTLKGLLIQPLRVDRVIHNDDIDDKILSLIKEADFCIADLTYSRPSVYYEAGYAFGLGKPVIYMARSDHFRQKNDDPYGNLNVHFDLQMKNIISWSKPNHTVKQKLQQRISKVISPLVKAKTGIKSLKEEEINFAKLSQDNRQIFIIDELKQKLKLPKYTPARSSAEEVLSKKVHICYGANQTIVFMAVATVSKKELKKWDFSLVFYSGLYRYENINELHIYLLSLNSVPKTRVMDSLPNYNVCGNNVYETFYEYQKKRIAIYLHIIDNIKSAGKLLEQITSAIKHYHTYKVK